MCTVPPPLAFACRFSNPRPGIPWSYASGNSQTENYRKLISKIKDMVFTLLSLKDIKALKGKRASCPGCCPLLLPLLGGPADQCALWRGCAETCPPRKSTFWSWFHGQRHQDTSLVKFRAWQDACHGFLIWWFLLRWNTISWLCYLSCHCDNVFSIQLFLLLAFAGAKHRSINLSTGDAHCATKRPQRG